MESMASKPGSVPQAMAWRRILPFLFAPLTVLVAIAVVLIIVAVFLGMSLVDKSLGVRPDSSVTSFVLGFLIAGFLGAVWHTVTVYTGGASSFMGATAERWTAKELAALGPDWHLFHNVPFVVGFADHSWEADVDHLAVGPYGVLVVESKLSSSPVDLDASRLTSHLRDAVRQVTDNAARVRAMLLRDAPEVQVVPVVVFWGRSVKAPKKLVGHVGTVRIVAGNDAGKWRPRLTAQQNVAPDVVKMISTKVAKAASR